MEKLLGQAAIDALFASARAGEEPALQPEPEVEAYNFSRAGQISADQLRAIATVNDLFARNLMNTVGAWLRAEFHVTLVSGEQMAFGEFVDRIPEKTYVSSLRLEPLGAPGLLEIDVELAAPMVDLLLGGNGRAEPDRALTDIEDMIMISAVQMMIKELNAAWQPVGLLFAFEKRESSAQVARMMASGEKTLCVCFEVKMPEARGSINLCLPSVVLNTILRKLIAVQARRTQRTAEMTARLREQVGEATVGAVLQFPPVRLAARELAALAPGQVLRLPLPRHAAAELRVGGLALSRARAVRMGEHRGARLEPRAESELRSAAAKTRCRLKPLPQRSRFRRLRRRRLRCRPRRRRLASGCCTTLSWRQRCSSARARCSCATS
jgi:flagellar motor switch protein FliM